jgi:hypothetical protein
LLEGIPVSENGQIIRIEMDISVNIELGFRTVILTIMRVPTSPVEYRKSSAC